MKTVITIALLLVASVAHADLRGAPPDQVACQVPPTCAGECAVVAANVCHRAGVVAVAGASVPVAGTSWQQVIVAGLGQFVADRAKAEVETWFEDLVRDKLCALATDGTLWFPHTCQLLRDTYGTGQQVASVLVIEAIKADMPNAFDQLIAYLAQKAKDPAAKREIAALIGAFPAAADIGRGLIAGSSPLQILKDTSADAKVQSACTGRADKSQLNAACLIVFTGITIDYYGAVIGETLKHPTKDSVKELAVKLLADGHYRDEVCAAIGGTNCADLPPALKPLIDATVITTPQRIDALFKVINDAFAINEYLRNLPPGPRSTDAVREEIAHTLTLLDQLWTDFAAFAWPSSPPALVAIIHDTIAASSALAGGDYRGALTSIGELAHNVPLPDWMARLLPLVLDLTEAKDSGDVAAAFERAAAPIGSWKLKRQKVVFSVGALVGGMFGVESTFRDRLGSQTLDKHSLAGGLMAPIGLEVSWPLCPVKGWSMGVLLSVLDVGQVTWSRLDEETRTDTKAGVKASPDPSFAQVVSPGAYLVVGVGHTPFTFGVGGAIAPDLREFSYTVAGEPTNQGVTVWRAGIFAAVDVTLFPF